MRFRTYVPYPIFEQHAHNLKVAGWMNMGPDLFSYDKCPWHFIVLEDLRIQVRFGYTPQH